MDQGRCCNDGIGKFNFVFSTQENRFLNNLIRK